jgi:hypothetical protein
MRVRSRFIVLLVTITITISLAFLNGPIISFILKNKGVAGFNAFGLALIYFTAIIPIEMVVLLVSLFFLMKYYKRKRKNELFEGFKYSFIYMAILTCVLVLIWSINS